MIPIAWFIPTRWPTQGSRGPPGIPANGRASRSTTESTGCSRRGRSRPLPARSSASPRMPAPELRSIPGRPIIGRSSRSSCSRPATRRRSPPWTAAGCSWANPWPFTTMAPRSAIRSGSCPRVPASDPRSHPPRSPGTASRPSRPVPGRRGPTRPSWSAAVRSSAGAHASMPTRWERRRRSGPIGRRIWLASRSGCPGRPVRAGNGTGLPLPRRGSRLEPVCVPVRSVPPVARRRPSRLRAGTGAGMLLRDGQLGVGFSWTAQPLPSGSLKKAKEFHGPPWPSFHSPSSM